MKFNSEHWTDIEDNPAGGSTWGDGFAISWQNGPRGPDDESVNGAVVDDILKAAVDRLNFYQQTKYACAQNGQAISMILAAIHFLEERKEDREKRGVEGSNEI